MEPDHSDEVLNWCSDLRPDYAILKTGIVLHHTADTQDRRTIAIPCDETAAEKLLFTARMHLNAARDIASALDPLREL